MMERRYEAYKTHVVKPFFREHVARLDRQIVLIDAMQALNAGPWAMADLERAVTEILACFRPGRGGILTDLFSHRIDRILIAATKADHLHHESHDRLQAIVRRIADRAVKRANFSGAEVDVLAMAAVRATREGTVKQGRETLPVIIGTPLSGETIGGETFDGKAETAIFPGDLPARADAAFQTSTEDAESGCGDALRALPAAETGEDAGWRDPVAAAHPARPRPAVSSGRPPRMTAPRKPAAFRIDEEPRPCRRRRRGARRRARGGRPAAAGAEAGPGGRRAGRSRRLRRTRHRRRRSRHCRSPTAPIHDRYDLRDGLRHPRVACRRPVGRPADPHPVRARRVARLARRRRRGGRRHCAARHPRARNVGIVAACLDRKDPAIGRSTPWRATIRRTRAPSSTKLSSLLVGQAGDRRRSARDRRTA